MPDNFGRMTSDEAPQSLKDFCFPKQEQKEESIYKHTPGPWTIYNHAGTDSGHYDGYLKSDIRAGNVQDDFKLCHFTSNHAV